MSTLVDLNLTEDKYILIYQGSVFRTAHFATNKVTSKDTVELFNTVQELFDRAYSLGLRCSTDDLLKAMEHGATLPQDVMDELQSYIWEDNPLYIKRMEALGYVNPNS